MKERGTGIVTLKTFLILAYTCSPWSQNPKYSLHTSLKGILHNNPTENTPALVNNEGDKAKTKPEADPQPAGGQAGPVHTLALHSREELSYNDEVCPTATEKMI